MAEPALKSAQTTEENALRVPAGTNLVEWYFEQGWTDGLPVVPPTRAQVDAVVEALGGDPKDAFLRSHQRGTARLCQFDEPVLPILTRISLRLGQEPEPDQRIVQLVSVARIGPCLLAHTRYRCLVETAHLVGGIRIKPAPAHHRLRAALFERGIVEIGVGPRRQHFEGQGRRLGQVARDDAHGACLDAPLDEPDRWRVVAREQAAYCIDKIGRSRQRLAEFVRQGARHLPGGAEARRTKQPAKPSPSASPS